MEYEGPTQEHLTNVRALNRAWLRLRPQESKGLPRFSDTRLERLASAPFLLFSFREHDDQWWRLLLDGGPQQDLLEERPIMSIDLIALQLAGLAFLSELARCNPYVARLISGAPLSWCEQIASGTLVDVLDCGARFLLIESRFDDASALHKRLWRCGGGAPQEMRVFAQTGALQAMLTSRELVPYRRMPAAACRMPQPAQQVGGEV
jgi:hypothetical protein